MQKRLIQQGAEATIFKIGNKVIKDRITKSYRLKELDESLRKKRTKKEVKLLEKASKIINTPKPTNLDDNKIIIPFISGKKLSEHLDKLKNDEKICFQIGEQIAKLHDNNIIHGDLTTSNMILTEYPNKEDKLEKKTLNINGRIRGLKVSNKNKLEKYGGIKNNLKVFFIDFGLGYESEKIEDKAVDLHVLKEALKARHYKKYEKLWEFILNGYKISKNSSKTVEKLKSVESRGRYKERY